MNLRPAMLLLACLTSIARADDVIPADPQPQWYKGNIHTHTLWSDGNDFPEMVCDWYRTNGYHFLSLSDHNVLSQGQRWMKVADVTRKSKGASALDKYRSRFGPNWVELRGEGQTQEVRLKPLTEFAPLVQERGKFLMIQGEEVTDKYQFKGKDYPVHMNATNVLELIKPRGGKDAVEVMSNNLAAMEESATRTGQPILPHLNHPNFHYAVRAEDLADAVKERFFEVYNGHPGTHTLGDQTFAGTEKIWDIVNALRIGKLNVDPTFGVGTDDSHQYHGGGMGASTPGRGWVMVRARHLTPESLIRAMKAGDFYASSGVVLKDVRYSPESKVLTVEVQPEEGAEYTVKFIGTPKDADLSAEAQVDKDGRVITGKYSDQIGKVLAETKGPVAEYQLNGKEMYVRAVVTSSHPPKVPSYEGQKAQAWTQPVGWQTK
jgi:hypothetical protein